MNDHHEGESRVRAGPDRTERLRLRTHLRDWKLILRSYQKPRESAVM